MNNEITGKLGNYMSTKNVKTSPIAFGASVEKNVQDMQNNISNVADSATAFEALGHAKINMDRANSVKNSAVSFMGDPMHAELHTDFCDGLLERGYKLEDAIRTTDTVFNTLKQKDTYKI